VAWYREGADVQRLLPQLSTYLGHVHVSATQRYLTMTPDLLHQASVRFETLHFSVRGFEGSCSSICCEIGISERTPNIAIAIAWPCFCRFWQARLDKQSNG
jgi:hypothetical protein